MTRRVDDVFPEAALPWAAFFIIVASIKGGSRSTERKILIPTSLADTRASKISAAEFH